MPVTLTGSVAVTGNVSMDPALPLIATAGSTTTVDVQIGNAISFSPFASVTGSIPPYTYVILSGTLPAGVTLNSSVGVVSGTTTTLYSSANVVFGVRDFFGNQASTTVTVNFVVKAVSYSVNYLVVAGGGGGGGNNNCRPGSGGGGGGFLSGSTCLIPGSLYTINIGGGGAGGTASPVGGARGTPGGSSNISGFGITTITAIGGGGGGAGGLPFANTTGLSGGSGGGGAMEGSPGLSGGGGLANGSPGIGVAGTQGFPGGAAGVAGDRGSAAGGAGGTGGSAAGGPGATWPFTGNIYGGGGAYTNQTPAPGGGGRSTPLLTGNPTPALVNGSTNTGGGAGVAIGTGALPYLFNGGVGGSGIVILAVPTPNYPGSAPGAVVTNPPAAPGRTVLTYNSSGTYTA